MGEPVVSLSFLQQGRGGKSLRRVLQTGERGQALQTPGPRELLLELGTEDGFSPVVTLLLPAALSPCGCTDEDFTSSLGAALLFTCVSWCILETI